MADLVAGSDWRLPEFRTEVFLRFYDFHTRHGAHPGCVYYLLPWLASAGCWSEEELLWFAFLNGNTQNPVTSLILHRRAPTPAKAPTLLAFFQENYRRLAFDTDRRHHKKAFPAAVESYLDVVGTRQAPFWRTAARNGWPGMWDAATSLFSFGRLSAWSYVEYLYIAGLEFEPSTLMLDDRSGSRSHRNGLAIVCGLDAYDWHKSNPAFDGSYPPDLVQHFEQEASHLLRCARDRAKPDYQRNVTLLTLESALCTYKSWHRPNRRYPNVYNDMLHDRIKAAEALWPGEDLSTFWEARYGCLPDYLQLECTPGDPGVAPVKQNWYREHGEVPVMGREDPVFWSGFDAAVDAGSLGRFR